MSYFGSKENHLGGWFCNTNFHKRLKFCSEYAHMINFFQVGHFIILFLISFDISKHVGLKICKKMSNLTVRNLRGWDETQFRYISVVKDSKNNNHLSFDLNGWTILPNITINLTTPKWSRVSVKHKCN